ncbi:hypothetical protein GF402_03780 [Candidatus Fermentibacteria bacterium]|nr:hypothetical protein [Candidatus Fermentibacteria bacterium]
MKGCLLALPLLAAVALTSGLEEYYVPGVESEGVQMSVHVWGEVRNPGTHRVPVNSDLVVALSAAGGPLSSADLDEVRIVYDSLEIEYDLEAFLQAEGSAVPVLKAGATVYVPRGSYEWWKDAVDFGYKILVAANLIWIMTER